LKTEDFVIENLKKAGDFISNFLIRELKETEIPLLRHFLYEAIYLPDPEVVLPPEIIKQPEISLYIDKWGQRDDLCLVALVDEKVIGAVWTRILSGKRRGYGNIDDKTPEFSISVFKEYRGQGIGKALMEKMIALLKEKGYSQASLSVAKDNYACKLYLDLGFSILKEREQDYLMILKWK